MKITADDAVNHIVNSLDNTHANYWYDQDEDVTWVVRARNAGVIEFVFVDENDDTEIQTFRLVEVE